MTPRFAYVQSVNARCAVAGAVLAVLIAAPPLAGAASRHHADRPARAGEEAAQRSAGTPIMAIVSLKSQRVTIYDADGWMQRAPVSTGQRGRETPSGVFSVIQKDAAHHSNLYDDAFMPHMQRITWSGIALHGGPLPGHAASHGCIRMPYGFAAHLFGETKLGMRVLVAPRDVAPVAFTHPALAPFAPRPEAAAHVAALATQAQDAASKADAARLAAVTANRESARASVDVRKLENLKGRAEAQLAAAEKALAAAQSDEAKAKAEEAKQKAEARVADLQAQWDGAKAALQPKLDALASAREAAVAAEAARTTAAKDAREAARELQPVSIFISRKAQRLYVRRGFEPVLDVPVTIRDPDQPIGTHVFTAVGQADNGLRWTVVTLDDGHPRMVVAQAQTHSRRDGGGNVVSSVAAEATAASALDRVTIPQEVLDTIAPTATARSSIIISDEALSHETGKQTDFIAVLSNEPQGGLAMRRRPSGDYRFARRGFSGRGTYGGGFSGGGFSSWW